MRTLPTDRGAPAPRPDRTHQRSRAALSSTANPLHNASTDPRPSPATKAVLDRDDRRS